MPLTVPNPSATELYSRVLLQSAGEYPTRAARTASLSRGGRCCLPVGLGVQLFQLFHPVAFPG